MIDRRIVDDAIVCVIKYLIEASAEVLSFELFNNGTIDKTLISNPIHIAIHE